MAYGRRGLGVRIATHVFANRVNNRAMTGELLADFPIHAAFVRPEM